MTKPEDKKCEVVMTQDGLKIEGPCSGQLNQLHKKLHTLSKQLGREISSELCIDPSTGNLTNVNLDTIGTDRSTKLQRGRVCPIDNIQLSMHTHPSSGIPKFSEADALTAVSRINEGTDEGHCVTGDNKFTCIIGVKSDYK